MFLKKSVSVLTVLVAGTIILFTACKKNDDVSASSGMPENQIASATTSTPSFTINSSNGNAIGINGTKPVVNPKTGQNEIMSCGSASGLIVQAVCANGRGFLYNGWNSGGGSVIALYINGQPYKDPNTGYGLWLSSVNGISVQISVSAGQTYRDFVRTYCSSDTTNSAYYDTPITSYVVPSSFLCGGTPPPPPPPTGGTTKGHKR